MIGEIVFRRDDESAGRYRVERVTQQGPTEYMCLTRVQDGAVHYLPAILLRRDEDATREEILRIAGLEGNAD